ncbi:hypothetical protein [Fodinibius sediminis]|uniref:Outer membrane protein beta-barrel domain-containing protein n=1 Tax=Fodinibius sediminis TaxID=1214077 RepID=A0A521APB7_9BACT|nr:hypothetical protein [Fodinibius sediminis]SMO36645.1 hypothetical protein SAMN06265218_101257 [Fodinibius sediminis]
MLRKATAFFLFLLSMAAAGRAQQSSYEQIRLDASGALSLLDNSFSRHWESSPGFHIGTRINYHAGNLEAGVRYSNYSARDPAYDEASFSAYFIYIGWEYPFRLARQLTFAPGLRFGNTFLAFRNPATYPAAGVWAEYVFDSHESEFAYELFGRLEYKLGNSPWHLHSSFSYNRTLTYHPLPVGLLSLGISRSLSTPSWLKNFLQ